MDKFRENEKWAEATRQCRLHATTVQMAKELGFKPETLIRNIPNRNQPWKAPVHFWIRDLYQEKFPERWKLIVSAEASSAPPQLRPLSTREHQTPWLDPLQL